MLLTFCVFAANTAEAQKKKKGFLRDLFRVKEPETIYVEPDTSQKTTRPAEPILVNEEILEEEEFDETSLKRELSLIAEDTSAVAPDSAILVEVAEELFISDEWVTAQEYFSVWDSYNINPYKIDAGKFADTVALQLYDANNKNSWSPPLESVRVTSNFGFRGYRWHYGTDIALNIGDSVRSVFEGIVRIRKYDPSGYGYYIVVRHRNGLETLYGHLSKQLVDVGQEVKAGEVIGLGGNTGRSSGPHLHFETRYMGTPLNPGDLYDFDANKWSVETVTITQANFEYLKEAQKVVYHRVRRGDTLSGIARRYRTSVSQLTRLNRLSKRSVLKIGQRIRVR